MEESSKNDEGADIELEDFPLPQLNANIQSIPSSTTLLNQTKKNKNINYLRDYSHDLFSKNAHDNKILNWQLENSKQLHQIGINPEELKQRNKEYNKKYYTYPNIINQLECKKPLKIDRYGKFGRLAPKIDIGRNFKKMEKKFKKKLILQQKQKRHEEIKENKEGINNIESLEKEGPIDINIEAKKKLEELNFYDLDDPFIDDEEDRSDDEMEEGLMNLDPGNYTEMDILKNIEKNKRKKLNPSVNNAEEGLPRISHISNENIIINDPDGESNSGQRKDPIFIELNQFYDKFLEANNLPIDNKDKFNLIKKLIQHYKRLKDDRERLGKLLQFVYDKTAVPKEDIKLLFEFENLKNKKEGIFSSLSKTYNKLVQHCTEAQVKEVSINNLSTDMKDKINQIGAKSREYLASVQELFDFMSENISKENLFESFISAFKSHRLNVEEAKDKISKKLKELLDKAHISYKEAFFDDVIKYEEKGVDVIILEEEDHLAKENEALIKDERR